MMAIDWNKAALALKHEVTEHGGFLTLLKDSLRERFDIGRLTERIAEDLRDTLAENGMDVVPHPYYFRGTLVRVYDTEGDVGRIALAVAYPQDVPETKLVDVVRLYARENAGKDRRSDDVPWLLALDIFLQLVIGRPPDGWEDLDDDREPFELCYALAESLGLPAETVDDKEMRLIAGAVCACRPHRERWDGAPESIGTALAEALRKQKESFNIVLREAAKYLLRGGDVPLHKVELGRLGLRYRREARGGVGWLR
jgi:hypothetical protein